MKEITFINRNKSRWEQFEKQLSNPLKTDPDEMANLFIQLTDDLAFARTFYPGSHTLAYLNRLSQKSHLEIYKNKKEHHNRLPKFFMTDLPLVLYSARKYFLISLLIFVGAVALGIASATEDGDFLRLILGDQYVEMTLDNIEKGDPMGVYGNESQMPMFLFITINNIRVSFFAFLMGFFTPLGSIYVLFTNGLMVGAFQTFFLQKNLLGVSTLAIMIHGTLELSAIVLAGGAGIILGKHILFPGSFPRMESFKTGVKKGTKIMLGLVPVFIIAGFLESFVTRYYNSISTWMNITIIGLSLIFIVWYFFLYPRVVYLKYTGKKEN